MLAVPESVAVIGFGRFGQLWAKILKDDFVVRVHDESDNAAEKAAELGLELHDLSSALASDVIFTVCLFLNSKNDSLSLAILRKYVRKKNSN